MALLPVNSSLFFPSKTADQTGDEGNGDAAKRSIEKTLDSEEQFGGSLTPEELSELSSSLSSSETSSFTPLNGTAAKPIEQCLDHHKHQIRDIEIPAPLEKKSNSYSSLPSAGPSSPWSWPTMATVGTAPWAQSWTGNSSAAWAAHQTSPEKLQTDRDSPYYQPQMASSVGSATYPNHFSTQFINQSSDLAISAPFLPPAAFDSAYSPTVLAQHPGLRSSTSQPRIAKQAGRQHSKSNSNAPLLALQSAHLRSSDVIPPSWQHPTPQARHPLVQTDVAEVGVVQPEKNNSIRRGRRSGGDTHLVASEEKLTTLTQTYLDSKDVNPYKGSVPMERIQNAMRSKHPDLYHTVVGTWHNSWRRYIERHADVFHLFSIEDGKWRVRLLIHTNFAEGDLKEQQDRDGKENHLIKCLVNFLQPSASKSCKVDDFMAAYPTLLENSQSEAPVDLPARGDLVRFVRRHSAFFGYDAENLSILLKASQWVHQS